MSRPGHVAVLPGVIVTLAVWSVTAGAQINRVVVTGNRVLSTERLLEEIHLKPGSIPDAKAIEQEVERIEKLYRTEGYRAEVVDLDFKQGVLTFRIREAVIESIQIAGLGKTRPFVVLREMKTKPGQVFDAQRLRRDLKRIRNVGLFAEATYECRPGSEAGKVVVVVRVKELVDGGPAVGIGLNSRNKLVGFVDWTHPNFHGKAQRTSFRYEFGDNRSWEAGFVEPWADRKHSSVGIEVFDRRIYREPRALLPTGTVGDRALFEEQRRGFRLTVGRPLSDAVSLRGSVKNEEVSLFPVRLSSIPLRLGNTVGRVSSLSLGIVRDTRDLPADSATGSRESLRIELANTLFGGSDAFAKWELDLRRYHSISPKGVIAGRLQAGFTSGGLPAYEQYFVGGAETIRGLNVDRAFGKKMILANLEYRHRLRPDLQVVPFMDYGDAWGWPFANHSNFDGLFGFGVGFRWKTPLGLVRLALGRAEGHSRLHVQVGQMF